MSKGMSAHENENGHVQDVYISGAEPRTFPGLARQREKKRRDSLKQSVGGSVYEGSVGDAMSASQHFEPGMEKYKYSEGEGVRQAVQDSD